MFTYVIAIERRETEVTYHGRRTTGPLNAVQVQILKLLADGLEHREVAERVGQSRVSVSENVRTAAMKMGVSTSTAAVARYSRCQAYYSASNQVTWALIPNPLGEAEEHVNRVLEGLAAELRATGDRLLPQ